MRTCPVCESNDSLLSIPGVVAHGTQRSGGTGLSHSDSYDLYGSLFSTQSHHTYESTTRTDLADELSFPSEQEPGDLHWRAGLALVVAGFGGLVYDGVATLVVNLILIGGFLGASLLLMGYTWGSSGLLRVLAGVVGAFVTFIIGANFVIKATAGDLNTPPALQSIIMVVLLILGVWTFVRGRRVRRAFQQAKPERDRAYRIWQGLYYCSRDNTVVDPESGRYGPPGALREFIYPR